MKASPTKGAPLRGRRCLVTGGGSGIGEGIAHRLAAAGASVAVLGRRRKHLNRVVQDLEAKKATAVAVTGDVTDEAGIRRAVARAGRPVGEGAVARAGVPPASRHSGWAAVLLLGGDPPPIFRDAASLCLVIP